MPIQYALFENKLTADPDDYAAIVLATASADGDDLVQDIIDQGTTITRPDILAVTAALETACRRRLEDGQRVNFFGLVEFFPRIKGIFGGAADDFDPARHRIDVGANPGRRLRDAVRAEATVRRVAAVRPAPNPIEYRDVTTGTTDDRLTPGGIGQLTGHRLKFHADRPDEGIFLIPVPPAGPETRVTTLQKNRPSQLVFLVPPDLAVGRYRLEVRVGIRGGYDLRTGRLDGELRFKTPP